MALSVVLKVDIQGLLRVKSYGGHKYKYAAHPLYRQTEGRVFVFKPKSNFWMWGTCQRHTLKFSSLMRTCWKYNIAAVPAPTGKKSWSINGKELTGLSKAAWSFSENTAW